MRLTEEQVKELSENYKEYMSQSDFYDNDTNLMYGKLLDTIEALKQEIEQIKNEQTEAVIDYQQELNALPVFRGEAEPEEWLVSLLQGDREELLQWIGRSAWHCKKAHEQQQEIQQLQAQNAAAIDDIKHALAVNRGCPICKHWNKADPLLPWCKIAKVQTNCFEWRGVSTTYYNPADVEAIKQKDAVIHQCFLVLQMCRADGLSVDADFLAEQALTEIKRLGEIEKAGGNSE